MQAIRIVLAGTLALSFAKAEEAWFYWDPAAGGNGHSYKAVATPDGITWHDANAAATAEGGYLATITSGLENALVFALVNYPEFWWHAEWNGWSTGPWIGGWQPPNSPEPGGNWTWITDEPFTYTNWAAGQPNEGDWPNYTQDPLHFSNPHFPSRQPTWNDLSWHWPMNGFVVEAEAGFTLTVYTGGLGTVDRFPDQESYPPMARVSLTALEDYGYDFKFWKLYDPNHPGDAKHAVRDNNNPIRVLMTDDREVDAIYGCSSETGLGLLAATMLGLALMGVAMRRSSVR